MCLVRTCDVQMQVSFKPDHTSLIEFKQNSSRKKFITFFANSSYISRIPKFNEHIFDCEINKLA